MKLKYYLALEFVYPLRMEKKNAKHGGAFKPSTGEAQIGGFLNLRLAWSIPGQPELLRDPLS